LNIRYGSRTLELAKGKLSVEVDNPNDLIKALEIIKNTVENDELHT
jgi:choline kinase